MAKPSPALRKLKSRIVKILKKNDVVKAGIFGSYATGDATKRSDIDILMKFKGKKSLLDLSGLKIELEEQLKKKVDLVTYKYLHYRIKDRILEEEIRLF